MENKQIKNAMEFTCYKLSTAIGVIKLEEDGMVKLAGVLMGLGFTKERLDAVKTFINESFTEEEYNELVKDKAYLSYVEGLQEIEKIMKIAKGYQEMGDINLTISKEDHHLEEEVANNGKMDTETVKGKNKTNG